MRKCAGCGFAIWFSKKLGLWFDRVHDDFSCRSSGPNTLHEPEN